MTIFAVVCAGIFPVFHVGRVWYAWFLFPLPNSNYIWQNFRSPLEWDVFAVSTYGTVSVLFWYVGMIPDLATHARPLRVGRARTIRARIYGFFAMGWRGSSRHWSNYEMAYLILAGISTPLVLSVHTIVSFDFAVSLIPGWHTTIFPPYFVAGAIFSGFGMVLTLILPLRAIYHLEDLITQYHIDCMCKIILATGTMVGYAYAMEFFIAWYGANPYEGFTFINRAFGPYWWAYWIMVTLQRRSRRSSSGSRRCAGTRRSSGSSSLFVNVGMWFERFVIIATSLARDFLPSSWGYYSPSVVEIFTFFGTFGVFSVLFLLFIRFLPIMAIAELKAVTPQADPHARPRTHRRGTRHGLRNPTASSPPSTAPGALMQAAEQVRDAGYQQLGLHHAVPGPRHRRRRWASAARGCRAFSLAGGITGFCTGMSMIWYMDAFDYPLTVGGKPLLQPALRLPGLLRADDPLHGLRDDRRHVLPERAADALPPGAQLREHPPRRRTTCSSS